MEAFFETQSQWGKLIITQDVVKVEPLWGEGVIGLHRTIQRSDIIGVEDNQTIPSVFGQGGAYTISLHLLNGETFEINSIPPKDSPTILQILKQDRSSPPPSISLEVEGSHPPSIPRSIVSSPFPSIPGPIESSPPSSISGTIASSPPPSIPSQSASSRLFSFLREQLQLRQVWFTCPQCGLQFKAAANQNLYCLRCHYAPLLMGRVWLQAAPRVTMPLPPQMPPQMVVPQYPVAVYNQQPHQAQPRHVHHQTRKKRGGCSGCLLFWLPSKKERGHLAAEFRKASRHAAAQERAHKRALHRKGLKY